MQQEDYKVTDYIANFLQANDIHCVFGVQGGAAAHLFDSLENLKSFKVVYCHHEQAAALAAVSYAKMSGKIGVVIVTTGPGSANAITGVLSAWQDSVPVIIISGQTRIEHTSYGKPVRQVGSQEAPILDLIQPITKFVSLVKEAKAIPGILNEAATIAISGRPGPVWIDLPVNLQWQRFSGEPPHKVSPIRNLLANDQDLQQKFSEVIGVMSQSKAPLIIAGAGIHAAKCENDFRLFIEKHNIPYVSSWTASDILCGLEHLNAGIIGQFGQRGANKIVFESDLIICLGTHLSATQTGPLFDSYATQAKKIIIDIDQGELDNLNIKFDLKICGDIRDFFEYTKKLNVALPINADWCRRVEDIRKLNSVIKSLDEKSTVGNEDEINSNFFNFQLTQRMPANSHLVVDGGGTALYTGFQSTSLRHHQRIICSSAISAMGTGLPESVGASFASLESEIYCVIGDGSLMFNLQELQTIRHHELPIKIIVYNNNGYLAIKHTQKAFLGNRCYGTDPENGLSVPNIQKIAECFSIKYLLIKGIGDIDKGIKVILDSKGPMLVEVMTFQDQNLLFQQAFRELEDGRFEPMSLSEMAPYA